MLSGREPNRWIRQSTWVRDACVSSIKYPPYIAEYTGVPGLKFEW